MGWGTGNLNLAFPKPGRTLSIFWLLAEAGYQMMFSRMQVLTLSVMLSLLWGGGSGFLGLESFCRCSKERRACFPF